ncbi:aromatic ring-hydroxylating dioxygenase subunit alpha [Aquincola tertiaricarbonis]|uniref:aromatic ring-hydroxylating dioxygenase subunit alpha n=1 Tax=Aquincola tertiaricarbonis TaxID=391953 RepID=UPI00061518A1|nr:aromatic ring-hydroxylating dioxygenase subunit alpha [Aquincola tertiaricarbonis]
MIEHHHYHPVLLASALDEARADGRRCPVPAQLLGTDLAIWRDAAGTVHAFDDRCPHRGASLSLGRIEGDRLECAYHGWQFAPGGRVVQVPAVPGWQPPEGHRARSYRAKEAYGLVWVALVPAGADDADVPEPPLPAFSAEGDAELRKVNCGPYDVATSAPRIVENFLDMAHFGYVHEGWLGARDNTAIEPYRVSATEHGFLATECRAWQPQSSVQAAGGAMVEYTYEVNAPYTAILTKVPDAAAVKVRGFRESIAMFVCPIEPERSRVWIRLAMLDWTSTDAQLQGFQHTIFSQDQPVLESQRPRRLPVTAQAPVTELHCAADRASTAYRRYLKERGITFGIC